MPRLIVPILFSAHAIVFACVLSFSMSAWAQSPASKSVEGIYTLFYEETFTENSTNPVESKLHILVRSDAGHDVYLAKELEGISAGDRVLVTGDSRGNDNVLQVHSYDVIASAAKKKVEEGKIRVAIILFNFRDRMERDTNRAEVDSVYFSGVESASDYFREVSYGKTWLEGEVFDNNEDWYTLDMDYPSGCRFDFDIARKVFEAVDNDIEWFDENGEQNYDRVVFKYPDYREIGCTSRASAFLNPVSIETPQGLVLLRMSVLSGNRNKSTVIHEQMHNFGVRHANAWRECQPGYVMGLGCFPREYGNGYDVMGQSPSVGHVNAVFRHANGWLDNVETVSASGTYLLHPLELPNDGPQALDVYRDATTRFMIEYRSGQQFISSTEPRDRQVVVQYYFPNGSHPISYALRLNSGPDEFGLKAGERLVDEFTGFELEVLQLTETHAEVHITLNEPALNYLLPDSLVDYATGQEQYNPRAWKDRAVWQTIDRQPGVTDRYDIYVCEPEAGADENCVMRHVSPGIDKDEQFPDIWEHFVVWQDDREGDENIYIYDLETDSEIPVAVAEQDQVTPRIEDDVIVWSDMRAGNWDIYACTLDQATGTCINEQAITTDPGDQILPVTQGGMIAWQDQRNDQGDIYYCTYDTTTGECSGYTELLESGTQAVPDVSGNRIVWKHCASDSACTLAEHIVLYDTVDMTTREVDFFHIRAGFAQGERTPALSGDLLVWDAASLVALMDLETGFTTLLSNYNDLMTQPAVSDGVVYFTNKPRLRGPITGLSEIMRFDYEAYKEALLVSRVSTETVALPGQVVVEQNYPNPAEHSTTISYSIPAPAFVHVEVFDMLGRQVLQPLPGRDEVAGNHALQFSTSLLAGGVYFYRVSINGVSTTRKMVVVK